MNSDLAQLNKEESLIDGATRLNIIKDITTQKTKPIAGVLANDDIEKTKASLMESYLCILLKLNSDGDEERVANDLKFERQKFELKKVSYSISIFLF